MPDAGRPTAPPSAGERRRVGVIGLGIMGGAMAARLLEAGHAVSGFDIDAAALARFSERGGTACDSPASAAQGAEVLLLMVHDQQQVERVLEGPSGALKRLLAGSVVWLGSTVPPACAAAWAERLAERGIGLIDGPVSGGATGAEGGELVAICGASDEALARAGFALRACTRHVYHVGPPGAGATVKMINQLLVAAHAALTAEAMALAHRAGVEPLQLIEVVSNSAGQSRIFDKRAPRIAVGDHAVHVSIDTLRKDLGIAIDTARQLGLAPRLALGVQALLDEASGAGQGADSDTRLIERYLVPLGPR